MNISGYRIEEKIGSGGMAIVYRAIQESLGRRVALKVMNPLLSDSEEFSRRFLEEARLLASIVHTHIITIHDFGISDGFHFISMEYVEGGDLSRRIREGIAAPQALAYMETIAECLGVAHDNHIVHRDIKPANILFRRDGTLLLTDFGIAKQLNAGKGLTSTGSMVGSPHYISPEQAQGKAVDGRADIYSLGILFYEMLVGERPFAGDSDVDIAIKQISEPLPDLPEDLADFRGLIDRMTRKKPDQRFPNCTSLLDAVQEVRTTGGWSGDVHSGPVAEIADPGTARADATVAKTVKLPVPSGDTVPLAESVAPADGDAAKRFGWRWYLPGIAACLVLLLMGGVLFLERWIDSVLPPVEPERVAAARPAAQDAAATSAPEADGQQRDEPGAERQAAQQRMAGERAARAEIARAERAALERARATQEKLERERLARIERERAERLRRERAAEEQRRQARVQQLLRNAEGALRAFRLTTPVETSAFTYYKQVLAIDPDNKAAHHGIDGIAESYYDLALSAERRWAYQKAIGYADTGLSVRPNHPGLRQLRNRLTADEGTAGRAFKETFKDVKALFD